jgi:enoyl-CoA hydratase
MVQPQDERVRVEDEGAVRIITFDRPAARNALSFTMRATLMDLLDESDSAEGLRVVILTGVDPAFSAGVDMKEHLQGRHTTGRGARNPGSALRSMRKPVVCAVNGACVTGALEIALSCSFIVASEKASFADTHAKIGLHPRWGMSALLPRAVGARKALEMSLTGDFIGAAEALRLGLVSHVVEHGTLLEESMKLAGRIASADPVMVATTVALARRGAGLSSAAALYLEEESSEGWQLDRTDAGQRFQSLTGQRER